MFINIFTAYNKYSLLNRGNLRRPIQTQLSQKQKTFSQFLRAFFRGRFNFEHFRKKHAPHS